MNLTWLLRMSKWSRRPPSWTRVKLVALVVALCLLLFGLEWAGLWPDWATLPANRNPARGFRP
ncbi:hypothetical protein [Phaeovulum sp.]|uniref:hypothetical protein n=1 Tax=Phaeovulum sp. TaxID=2934796 RepID=UPI0039E27CA8